MNFDDIVENDVDLRQDIRTAQVSPQASALHLSPLPLPVSSPSYPRMLRDECRFSDLLSGLDSQELALV